MNSRDPGERQRLMTLDGPTLTQHQVDRLNRLLHTILPHNRFYAAKLSGLPVELPSLGPFEAFPFTFKEELVDGAIDSRYAANLTWPVDRYVRLHRTSGTRGRPLMVLDTREDWQWWMKCWEYVLDAGEISCQDRVMMAFSFGPFIGFWSAYDAVIQRQALCAPAGGLSTLARIDLLKAIDATAVFCTPSYALHMAEVAADNQTSLAGSSVQKIVVAGEPGGSIPEIRGRIEKAWQARVVDHSGASEVGPWGFADPLGRGVYVNEAEFIAEFFAVDSGEPAAEGQLSELVLTSLGRYGSPVIRYRTGDLVRPTWNDDQDCSFVLLQGGVLGRVDDMLIVRGVNIFPSSVEQILRGFPEIVEYRMTAGKQGEMDTLTIEIEDRLSEPERVKRELRLKIGLKVDVVCVPIGTLPRFELKGQRFIDERNKARS
jgi:phenylacetate-CoA ligase